MSFAPKVLGSLVLGLVLASLATAAPTAGEIARAVRELGDDNFTVRERASKLLWAAGKTAEPALREALKNNDAEVVRRARELLDKFRYGIYPDTPQNIVDLITRYRIADFNGKQEVIRELAKLGSQGYSVLLKLATAEEDVNQRRPLLQQISQEVARALPTMLADGNPGTVEEVLEMVLSSEMETLIRSYAAFHLVRGKLDEKIAQFQAQADKDNVQAAEVLAHLCRARGDLPAARKAAEKTTNTLLLESLLQQAGDWKELARRQRDPKRPREVEIERLGYQAAYDRLSGSTDDFRTTVAEIRKYAGGEMANSGNVWFAAKALFLNDQSPEALTLLRERQNFQAAFEILCAQMKYREAFDLAAKVPNGGMPFELRKAQVLSNLGEKDKAEAILAQAAAKLKEAPDLSPFLELIRVEHRLGLKDRVHEHAAAALARATNEGDPSRVLALIFPSHAQTADVWWKFLRQKFAQEDTATSLKRLRELLEGQAVEKDLAAWTGELEQASQGMPAATQGLWLQALAETHLRAGKEDPARGFLVRAAQVTDAATHWVRLGDFQVERKQWKGAAESYGKAWERDRTQPMPLYLRGWALVQAGQEKEGQKAMDLAHLLPLADERARYALAETLTRLGLPDAARREREVILRTGRYDSWHVGETMRHLSYQALMQNDYLRAADLFEQFMLRCLRTNIGFVEVPAYVTVPNLVHQHRARGLVQAGKMDEAKKEWQVCLTTLPGNVNLAIQLVPELEKRGRKQEAEELFQQVFTLHEKLCADYPQSAWGRNSLAWLAACCRRQLDKALEHSQKANELSPQNAGYLDTLAEVHFQRGDRTRALELMKKCLELEPKREYFRVQLKRIEAGDPAVPTPPEDGS